MSVGELEPILHGGYLIDIETGDAFQLNEAPDRLVLQYAASIQQLDRDVLQAKRILAGELKERHGVGKAHAGGYQFTVAESQSWPTSATWETLTQLLDEGRVSQADVDRAMPLKRKPEPRELKALISRLTVSDPDAARVLADACTVSPASVREVARTSVDAESEAA